MEWDCAAKVAVVKEAEFPVSATVASVAAPSLKVMVPVGVPDVAGGTVEVKVIDFPYTDGKSVTFTATVHPAASGTPTGTITFKDGAATLATVALTGNSASF